MTEATRDATCTGRDAAAEAMAPERAARLAAVLRALADPLRLRMLSVVATSESGEACVCELATVAEVSRPTVSHHLKVLRDTGVLAAERRGTWVHYRLAPGYRTAVTALFDGFAPVAAADRSVDGRQGRDPHQDPLGDVDGVLGRIADRLSEAFPGPGRPAVLTTVRESFTELARAARVDAHLPALTERFARERLADRTRAGAAGRARPQVLFVCTANAGRSQLAAALTRRHAGDAVVVRSAGSRPAADVHGPVRAVLAELGETDAYPKPLTDDALRAADVVITMGCGDACPVLPGKRYEDWAVGDPALASAEGVAAIRDDLDARVRALLADLVPGLAASTPRPRSVPEDPQRG